MLDHLTQTEQEQQEEQKQSDPESISSNEVFFKQLFEMFDADKLGFISVDNVVNKFKQDIADPANSEDKMNFNLNQLVNSLDPHGLGRIDYAQFVNGMTKLWQDDCSSNNYNSTNTNQDIKSKRSFSYQNSENMEQTFDLVKLNYNSKPTTANRRNAKRQHFYNEEGYEEEEEDEDEEDEIERSNYESSTNNNTLEEIFEHLNEDENTHNSPSNKSRSSNGTDNFDFLEEINNSDSESKTEANETDEFGLDTNLIMNHRKSIFESSSSTSIKRQQFLQKKRFSLSFSALEDPEDSENGSDQAINDELSKYESIVKKLEIQIMSLTNENESLRTEINEQISRNKNLNNENLSLVEKLQGAEEQMFEMERRNHFLMDEEKLKQQDLMNKMYSAHIEDQSVYLNQIKTLESHLNTSKLEHSVQSKKIIELNQIIETKDILIQREQTKLKRLMDEIAELNSNIRSLEEENAKQIDIYDKQIKQLLIDQDEIQNELNAKENILINLQNNDLSVQNELNMRQKLEKSEFENQELRNEIENLNSNLEILNSQIYKNSGGTSIFFIQQPETKESIHKNETSLEFEINTMSREEILNKLVQEQQLSARLKDYIDDLVPKIIEHCPKIFEIKTV